MANVSVMSIQDDFARLAVRCEPAVRAGIVRDASRAGLDVNDIVQEAVSRGLPHADELQSESRVLAWLTVVARRVLIDRTRSAYHQRVSLHADVTTCAAHATTDPITATVEGQLGTRMRRALASLPPSQRRALVAHVVDGMSRREIAEELGLSYAAVGPLLYRATRALRDRYERTMAVVVLPATRLRRFLSHHYAPSEPVSAIAAGVAAVVFGVLSGGHGGTATTLPTTPGGVQLGRDAAAPVLIATHHAAEGLAAPAAIVGVTRDVAGDVRAVHAPEAREATTADGAQAVVVELPPSRPAAAGSGGDDPAPGESPLSPPPLVVSTVHPCTGTCNVGGPEPEQISDLDPCAEVAPEVFTFPDDLPLPCEEDSGLGSDPAGEVDDDVPVVPDADGRDGSPPTGALA